MQITNNGKPGGVLGGKPHSEGGVKAIVVDTNRPVELESEEVIITKPAVKDPKVRTLTGTNKEILSEINQSGGGVPIMEKGGSIKNKMLYGGSLNYFNPDIDDSKYLWNIGNDKVYELYKNGNAISLDRIINHPVLFKKYPHIGKILVRFGQISDEENAADSYIVWDDTNYIFSTIYINLHFKYYEIYGKEKFELTGNRPECSKEAILLHEIQHICQRQDKRKIGRSYDDILQEVIIRRQNTKGLVGDVDTPSYYLYKHQPSEQEAMRTVFNWLQEKGLKYVDTKYFDWDYKKSDQVNSQEGIYDQGGEIRIGTGVFGEHEFWRITEKGKNGLGVFPKRLYTKEQAIEQFNKNKNTTMETGGNIETIEEVVIEKPYYEDICDKHKGKLGSHFIGSGTRIVDNRTGGAVSEVMCSCVDGLKVTHASSLPNFPKQEFFIPYSSLETLFSAGDIDISGYGHTEQDGKILHLAIKDMIQCAKINELMDDIQSLKQKEEDRIKGIAKRNRIAKAIEMDTELDMQEEMEKGGNLDSNRIKLKEIIIHWAEGKSSYVDRFPKTYTTWESANEDLKPLVEKAGQGYNKAKFTVIFQDEETYDGRLDLSETEDNANTTSNVIGQHIYDYLSYHLSDKSESLDSTKKEIKEWLDKYDLGIGELQKFNKGIIDNQYEGKSAEFVWNSWNTSQREHFLMDHFSNEDGVSTHGKEFNAEEVVLLNYDNLPQVVFNEVRNHVSEGQYGKGGIFSRLFSKKEIKPYKVDYFIGNSTILHTDYYKTKKEADEAFNENVKKDSHVILYGRAPIAVKGNKIIYDEHWDELIYNKGVSKFERGGKINDFMNKFKGHVKHLSDKSKDVYGKAKVHTDKLIDKSKKEYSKGKEKVDTLIAEKKTDLVLADLKKRASSKKISKHEKDIILEARHFIGKMPLKYDEGGEIGDNKWKLIKSQNGLFRYVSPHFKDLKWSGTLADAKVQLLKYLIFEGKDVSNTGDLDKYIIQPHFEVGDIVYNKDKNTIGIVRLNEEYGEVKTDADGNVSVSDLEHYNSSNKNHKEAHMAPSTAKELMDSGRFEKGGEIAIPSTNLHIVGRGRDVNGNYIIKLAFVNQRAFSIQTGGGTLPSTEKILKSISRISSIPSEDLLLIENEVVEYITKYGSKKQKKSLKVYLSQGGKLGFRKLSKKIAEGYVGKPVSKEYQDKYGKTYSAEDAQKVGNSTAAVIERNKGRMDSGGYITENSFVKFITDQINFILSQKKVAEKKSNIKNLIDNMSDYKGSDMQKRVTEDNLKYALQQKTSGDINKILKNSINAL